MWGICLQSSSPPSPIHLLLFLSIRSFLLRSKLWPSSSSSLCLTYPTLFSLLVGSLKVVLGCFRSSTPLPWSGWLCFLSSSSKDNYQSPNGWASPSAAQGSLFPPTPPPPTTNITTNLRMKRRRWRWLTPGRRSLSMFWRRVSIIRGSSFQTHLPTSPHQAPTNNNNHHPSHKDTMRWVHMWGRGIWVKVLRRGSSWDTNSLLLLPLTSPPLLTSPHYPSLPPPQPPQTQVNPLLYTVFMSLFFVAIDAGGYEGRSNAKSPRVVYLTECKRLKLPPYQLVNERWDGKLMVDDHLIIFHLILIG